jgi:hypothetical protein
LIVQLCAHQNREGFTACAVLHSASEVHALRNNGPDC